jgi:hypothetical protein
MAAPTSAYPLPRLAFGHGPVQLDAFLEPTCPFSKRAFEKFRPLVDRVGADKLTVNILFVSQPWHLYSPVVTRAILAASATAAGPAAALRAIEGVFEHRENFEFEEHHCTGPNMDRTPAQILAEVGKLAGMDLKEAWCLESVDRAMRWHARFTRQNGIHSSPSFVIGGLFEAGMSSGQTVEEWAELVRPHIG